MTAAHLKFKKIEHYFTLKKIFQKKFLFTSLFLLMGLAALPKSSFAQNTSAESTVIKSPKVEIVGTMQETTDYFGRKRFIGRVINKEKARIDYIKITFTLRDREGNVLSTKSQFIKGQRHRFRDFQVSTSSLAPNRVGSFNIITDFPADSVYSFSFNITGKHYLYR